MISDIYEMIVELKKKGKSGALATIISTEGSAPREAGSKMLIYSDGSIFGTVGGGSLEATVIKEALNAIKSRRTKKLRYSLNDKEAGELGMICGGETEILIEPILPIELLYIFGAGHIAIPLCKIGKIVGFRVVVLDDRSEYASKDRFPEADDVLTIDYKSIDSLIEFNNSCFIVIVTRGHRSDELVLKQVIDKNVAYIGMIGSQNKVNTIITHLLEDGVDKALVEKVYAPIGIDIGAETPEEIAVSIIGQIIKVKRSGV